MRRVTLEPTTDYQGDALSGGTLEKSVLNGDKVLASGIGESIPTPDGSGIIYYINHSNRRTII